jgi:hypothetical protein
LDADHPANGVLLPRRSSALKSSDLGKLRSNAGVLMIQISGSQSGGLILGRASPDLKTWASDIDHKPDTYVAGQYMLFPGRKSTMYVFGVPPGRWRISGVTNSSYAALELNFCLGSPSFEIKAGDVLYAGAFDMDAADIGPDLDLAPAKRWLGSAPQTERLQAVSYMNGSRAPCSGDEIYALEVKGAPFDPSYQWGSKAPLLELKR